MRCVLVNEQAAFLDVGRGQLSTPASKYQEHGRPTALSQYGAEVYWSSTIQPIPWPSHPHGPPPGFTQALRSQVY